MDPVPATPTSRGAPTVGADGPPERARLRDEARAPRQRPCALFARALACAASERERRLRRPRVAAPPRGAIEPRERRRDTRGPGSSGALPPSSVTRSATSSSPSPSRSDMSASTASDGAPGGSTIVAARRTRAGAPAVSSAIHRSGGLDARGGHWTPSSTSDRSAADADEAVERRACRPRADVRRGSERGLRRDAAPARVRGLRGRTRPAPDRCRRPAARSRTRPSAPSPSKSRTTAETKTKPCGASSTSPATDQRDSPGGATVAGSAAKAEPASAAARAPRWRRGQRLRRRRPGRARSAPMAYGT